ncbi:MAG: LytR C-terminal domain-containing protein, partial [Actinomycetota bacterium]|nr:LytR C-terminal domain-containing protein [Actinomycetota bacterium]
MTFDGLGVLNAATESLTTDPQLANIENLRDLALSMKDLRPKDITFTTMPWKQSGDGSTVVVAKKRAAPLWSAIANDTPWSPKANKDQPLLKAAPQDVRVEIINATGQKGTGKQAKRALTNEGFTVVNVKKIKAERIDEYPAEDTIWFDPEWDVS